MVEVLTCDGEHRLGHPTSWFFYEQDGYSWMIEVENTGRPLREREYGGCFRVLKWQKRQDVETFANSEISVASPLMAYGRTSRQLRSVRIDVGTYHPRIWRPGLDAMPFESRDQWTTQAQSVMAARLLCERLVEIFGTIEPSQENLSAFGHRIRDVLVLACMEVESAWSAVLHANGFQKDRLTTNDYVKLCGPMLLSDFTILSSQFPIIEPFRPFSGWDDAQPTESLPWYSAYNSTKHDRERNFQHATLEHAIHAVGAVLVMIHAQFAPCREIESCFTTLVLYKPESFYIPSVDPRLDDEGTVMDGWPTKQFEPVNHPF